jgi:hypothetical protein
MIVINSAAYVISELKNELGSLPPCFLPIGNKKLIEYQVNELRSAFTEDVLVSLPSSYRLSNHERNLLEFLNINYVACPDEFTLSEALIYILNLTPHQPKTLRLLHGDTLIQDLPLDLDIVSIGNTSSEYEWEFESSLPQYKETNQVWTGFFSFSRPRDFIRCLTLSRRNFVAAVRRYDEECVKLSNRTSGQWLDLGHISTFFSSRSKITTQRSFNKIRISEGVVYKTGFPSKKIEAEGFWIKNIPAAIKKYTPNLIDLGKNGSDSAFYATEYLPCLPLNELYVHGRNSVSFWSNQASILKKFFADCKSINLSEKENSHLKQNSILLYREKTLSRLQEFFTQLRQTPSSDIISCKEEEVIFIAKRCIEKVIQIEPTFGVCHGDLCFSNILYDSRLNSIKVIDPRGLTANNEISHMGDINYDLAKLMHSIVGMYDFIIAGAYEIKKETPDIELIAFDTDERFTASQAILFNADFIPDLDNRTIMPVVVLLFLSMLPLHADRPDRQKAMLLNAIRLYSEYVA